MKIKLLNYPFVTVLMVFFLLSGCKKEDPTTKSQPTPTGTMTAKIDNVLWEATDAPGTLLKVADQNAKRLDLRGTADNQRIILTLEDVYQGNCVNLGDYKFEEPYYNALFTYSTITSGGGSITQHFPIDGTFTISECDLSNKTVSGTFNFRLESATEDDTLVVTDGVFTDYPYIVLER